MEPVSSDVLSRVFARLRQVQRELGMMPIPHDDPELLLAEQLDSMGLVELLGVLADEFGVRAEDIEKTAGHRFSTIASLASAVERTPKVIARPLSQVANCEPGGATCWLSAVNSYLPRTIEPASTLDRRLNRPPGWLESHAGIKRRHVWADEDAVTTTAQMGRGSLNEAGLQPEDVGALLVTSQAPPQLAGLAAALHQRLGLSAQTPAFEVGGACTGFMQALWLARNLMGRIKNALVIAVESPSLHLLVEPGEAGEAAALLGDGAACCVVSDDRRGKEALPLVDVEPSFIPDTELLRVEGNGREGVRVWMDGPRLAARAVESLANLVRQIADRHQQPLMDLAGVLVHAGNGRMGTLLARRLGLVEDRIWSVTAETGNPGSASLPMAWARAGTIKGPVAWVAIGAGLTLASAMTLAP